MKLDENSNVALIGDGKLLESLCSGCIHHGATYCPSYGVNANEKVEDFQQIKKYKRVNLRFIVLECSGFGPRAKKPIQITRSGFAWDSKTRSFVKANRKKS